MKVSIVLILCFGAALSRKISPTTASGSDGHTEEHSNNTNNITKICGSKNIRNSFGSLNQLRGCRVIEGFLIIANIDGSDWIKDLEFRELTEVRDFVVFFQVNGLKSLGKLFPNLRVIRGNYLLDKYALVVYGMIQLQEIGLKSLLKITRGSVRIERNPLLCFAETINWSLITSEASKSVFKYNKMVSDCPTCNCITGIISPNSSETDKRRTCWNPTDCQRTCSLLCGNRTCNSLGQCCDEKCIDCADDDPKKCLSCRFLSLGHGENLQCVEKCPSDMFVVENQRCVAEQECRNIRLPYTSAFYSSIKKECIEREDGECAMECLNDHCEYRVHTLKSSCPPGISRNSNEDNISRTSIKSCTKLSVNITKIGDDEARIEIETLQYDDSRQLLGYIVHYVPSPFQNATMNEGEDSFGDNAWTSEFLQYVDQNARKISHIFADLKPNTQYAYYAQTFTVPSEELCGLSSIQYFTTQLPAEPKPITKLKLPKEIFFDKNALDKMAKEVEESNEFENELQNIVYMVKKWIVGYRSIA